MTIIMAMDKIMRFREKIRVTEEQSIVKAVATPMMTILTAMKKTALVPPTTKIMKTTRTTTTTTTITTMKTTTIITQHTGNLDSRCQKEHHKNRLVALK